MTMPETLTWEINGGHHLSAWVSGTELFEISPSGGIYRLAFECIVCFKSLYCGDFPISMPHNNRPKSVSRSIWS